MMRSTAASGAFAVTLLLCLVAEAAPALDCDRVDCGAVLGSAVKFVHDGDAVWRVGLSSTGARVGWVVRSTDVVDIKGYSGKPLVTLVGLRTDGTISGVRVLEHSEPILLVGIPEQALTDFVGAYRNMPAGTKVVLGASDEPGARTVDVVSGATVTVLAENRTILETARAVGVAVGAIEQVQRVPGHFVREDRAWSWAEMAQAGALGRLVVSEQTMGVRGGTGTFIDLHFAIADPPQIGRGLLGDREYAWQTEQLAPGEHLLVVLGNGSSSFKGSGFVRGGIFDRVRVEQGLRSVMFTDHDYRNFTRVAAPDAPAFKEGAVFVIRPGKLDPGAPFDFVFLGSRYNQQGGFARDFHAVRATHQIPRSIYVLDGLPPERVASHATWHTAKLRVGVLLLCFLFVSLLFGLRIWLTTDKRRLKRLHLWVLLLNFLVLGVWMRAQPSVTQILTAVGSFVGEWRWPLFLSDPVIFMSWVFIAVVTVTWGRGVFCGWVCPYGALNELVFALGRALRLPTFELPDWLHLKLRWARYLILFGLLGVYLVSPVLGEQLAEVEPFKTTFFVRPWLREAGYLAWWIALLVASLVVFRPFCRYLCPLGAALAIPGSLRFNGPLRRDFCSSCKICARECEPRAIRPDGTIDPRECLSCMECEANYRDVEVCPPLVKIERDRRRKEVV